MRLDFHGLLFTLSFALDSVEGELIGVSTGHSKRVAYISSVMGRAMGMSKEELEDLTACAVLHDNALTQYITEENQKGGTGVHCTLGEQNVKDFPFHGDVKGVILYHHETADGTGPFGKYAKDTPLASQLIHFADILDAKCNLGKEDNLKYEEIHQYLKDHEGSLFLPEHVDLFDEIFTKEKIREDLLCMADKLPEDMFIGRFVEYSNEQVKAVIDIFADIVDYKSVFTRKHSIEIAEKSYTMGKYYGYSDEVCFRLYVAGALHDVGKMVISNDVLEKPGKLTDAEFTYMQSHAWYTYVLLSNIEGFEDITRWAARHHEKLNGKGYPFGMTGEELDKNDRLMACLDIYQALREKRPYKDGLDHEKTLDIMRNMVVGGYIDGDITEDISRIFAS